MRAFLDHITVALMLREESVQCIFTFHHPGESRDPSPRHSVLLRAIAIPCQAARRGWARARETIGPGFPPRKHLVGSVDADGGAEGLADRTVQDEVGDCVEAGWLAVDDHQGRAVVFRQFRKGGCGINDQ